MGAGSQRNQPCRCGSGIKQKRCCGDPEFTFVEGGSIFLGKQDIKGKGDRRREAARVSMLRAYIDDARSKALRKAAQKAAEQPE